MEPLRIIATALPLDPIADEAIAHVYGLWNARRGARPMPAPGELLPEEFGVALGRVNLLDVLRDPRRFVYRVRSNVASEYRRMILPLGTADGVVERLLTVSAWGADFVRKAVLLGFKRR